MTINRDQFFDYVRAHLFDRKLKPGQVEGLTAMLDKWEKGYAARDDRWLAYMLGTAHHETGRTMQPVRETFAPTDEEAVRRLERAFTKGVLTWVKKPYWRLDDKGMTWLGRGLVQITHKTNYAKLGDVVKVDLVANPSLAMQMDVALAIMFEGMIQGSFTNKKLADYFSGPTARWREARQIINGLESADKVAGYAKAYYAAISYTT